jgi:hypothetical protein
MFTYNIQFFVKNYLQDVNTHTSVPDSTKIVPGQPIYLQNTRCARGSRCYLVRRYSSEKNGTKEKTLQQKVMYSTSHVTNRQQITVTCKATKTTHHVELYREVICNVIILK